MNRKLLPAVGLAAAVALLASGCATVNTEPDENAIVYNGQLGTATKFGKCVPSAKREEVSVSDNTWTYPFGQRTLDFTGGQDSESKPLSVASKDNVELTVPGTVTFSLNTDCKTLQLFHERIGRKYSAYFYGTDKDYSEDGWKRMLNFYLKGPLDRAMDAASQEFEWRKLFNDPKTKQEWEARVGVLARQFIKDTGGGEFFCQPNYAGTGDCGSIVLTIQKPQPPAELVKALAAEQVAKAQDAAQQQINAKVRTEMQSIKDLADVLGPNGAVLWQAIQKGQVTVVPVPQGSAINVNPK